MLLCAGLLCGMMISCFLSIPITLAETARDVIYFDEPNANQTSSQEVQPGQAEYYFLADTGFDVDPTEELIRVNRAQDSLAAPSGSQRSALGPVRRKGRPANMLETLGRILQSAVPPQLNIPTISRSDANSDFSRQTSSKVVSTDAIGSTKGRTSAPAPKAPLPISSAATDIVAKGQAGQVRQAASNVPNVQPLQISQPADSATDLQLMQLGQSLRSQMPQLQLQLSVQPLDSEVTARARQTLNPNEQLLQTSISTLRSLQDVLPLQQLTNQHKPASSWQQDSDKIDWLTDLLHRNKALCEPCNCSDQQGTSSKSGDNGSTSAASDVTSSTTTVRPQVDQATPAPLPASTIPTALSETTETAQAMPTEPTDTAAEELLSGPDDYNYYGDNYKDSADDFGDWPSNDFKQHPIMYYNINPIPISTAPQLLRADLRTNNDDHAMIAPPVLTPECYKAFMELLKSQQQSAAAHTGQARSPYEVNPTLCNRNAPNLVVERAYAMQPIPYALLASHDQPAHLGLPTYGYGGAPCSHDAPVIFPQ